MDLCVCFLCQHHRILIKVTIVQFEIKECDTSSFVLSENCFGYLKSFVFPCKFRFICSSSVKNAGSILTWIALNL